MVTIRRFFLNQATKAVIDRLIAKHGSVGKASEAIGLSSNTLRKVLKTRRTGDKVLKALIAAETKAVAETKQASLTIRQEVASTRVSVLELHQKVDQVLELLRQFIT